MDGQPGYYVHGMSLLILVPLGVMCLLSSSRGLLAACALVIPAPSELNISVSGCAGICLSNFFSSCSSGKWQGVLSLGWTRCSRSGQRRAKSETPDFGLGVASWSCVFSDPRIQHPSSSIIPVSRDIVHFFFHEHCQLLRQGQFFNQ